MKKLEHALRPFIIAGIAVATLVTAGPASASTYTMQDYYNALAAVDNDNQAISSLQADISSLEGQISWANNFYQWMVDTGCSGAAHSGVPSNQINWDAYYDCQNGWYAEWGSVVSSLDADISADNMALAFAYAQLSTDEGTLALIRSDLGL